ncbi:Peroxidase [Armadillidium vulgare]|nr:Peroxidase [Armadillidium vulgare]
MGIGTYSQLRDYCRMRPLIDFESMKDYIDDETISKLKSVYNDQVEDVDAFIAGISEKAYEKGGILGPLFNCIVTKQFLQLKYGDRFF